MVSGPDKSVNVSFPAPRGSYGFEVLGLDHVPELLVPASATWPPLHVIRTVLDGPPTVPAVDAALMVRFDDDTGEVRLPDGGSITLDRATQTVRLETRGELDDQMVVHPYLAFAVAVASHWLGRQVLHGGAFLHEGLAIGLLGSKEAGKSSTLAGLLAAGRTVLTDDLLVIDDGELFSGPRCVDLRGDAGLRLGGIDLGQRLVRERWRLPAGEAPPSSPLGGIVHLEWTDRIVVEPLGVSERLAGLVRHTVVQQDDPNPFAYLDLAALPAWRFGRPRDLDQLDRGISTLLAALTE